MNNDLRDKLEQALRDAQTVGAHTALAKVEMFLRMRLAGTYHSGAANTGYINAINDTLREIRIMQEHGEHHVLD